MLRVVGVSKAFGGRKILADVSFSVEKGLVAAIMGPNAVGKTTMLKIIAGLVEPDRGEVWIGEELVFSLKGDGKRATIVKKPWERDVGYVPAVHGLFPHLTIRQNIELPLRKRGWGLNEINKRVRELSEMLALSDYLDLKPPQVSRGVYQKASIARAVAPKPQVLLMDEPFSAIDIQMRPRIRGDLRRFFLSEGVTVLYATHLLDDMFSTADKLVFLLDGKVLYEGPVSEQEISRELSLAEFIGYNVIKGVVNGLSREHLQISLRDGASITLGQNCCNEPVERGTEVMLVFSPWNVEYSPSRDEGGINTIEVEVESCHPMPGYYEVRGYLGQTLVKANIRASEEFACIENKKILLKIKKYYVHRARRVD